MALAFLSMQDGGFPLPSARVVVLRRLEFFCNIQHTTQTDDVSMSPDNIAMDVTSLHITSLKSHY